jgi:hypothetical protein
MRTIHLAAPRPRPLTDVDRPRPRPRPPWLIFTGFSPVTFSASNAATSDSALRRACALPEALACSTLALAAARAVSWNSFCCDSSSAIAVSTQDRHLDFPSPLAHWFRLKASAPRLVLQAEHVLVSVDDDSSFAAARLAAAAVRSASSASATHFLHFSLPPSFLYLSRA